MIFQTYLVSGGYTGSASLSSTELLVETASAWVYTGELPTPRSGLCGANIDNKVLMTGNWWETWELWNTQNLNIAELTITIYIYLGGGRFYVDSYIYYEDILEFDPLTGQWKLVDKMMQARGYHAVSVIDFESGLCV